MDAAEVVAEDGVRKAPQAAFVAFRFGNAEDMRASVGIPENWLD